MSIIQFPGNTIERTVDKPAQVVDFNHGCKNCANLIEVFDGTFICCERLHDDDKPIVPVVQDEYTSDWGYCGGEYYERSYNKASGNSRR